MAFFIALTGFGGGGTLCFFSVVKYSIGKVPRELHLVEDELDYCQEVTLIDACR